MSEDNKIIFSMSGVSKTLPHNNKTIIKDIYLSFFYGAKIGILGLNGSGKSTLLKIIAGVDKNFQGDVAWSDGYSVGYLEQEPHLDEEKTVLEVVKEGAAEVTAILDEYNSINDQFGLPEVYENPDKMDKLMARQAELQDKIDASNAWDLEVVPDLGHGFLQLFHVVDQAVRKAVSVGQRLDRNRKLTGVSGITYFVVPHQALTITAWDIFKALMTDQRDLHVF